ncbi:hypothetical protein ACFFSY_04235 [Paenibacillus aurantiacus]|uniref:Tissue inhibitor of metalloproteinase n=1 Tax=Paenibacillus aurantiacus TaxID=1936118 RepID=A0ABV5KIT2_9BACL
MNKVFRFIMLAILAWSIMATGAPSAYATKCVQATNVEESYNKYDAVVLGYVKQKHSGVDGSRIDFQVMQGFKGMEPGAITIADNSESNLLTNSDAPDEELYLLYLNNDNGEWEHPICAPSARANAAGEDLTYLLSHAATSAPVEKSGLSKGNTVVGVAWIITASAGFIGAVVYLVLLYRRPDL